MVRFLHKQPIKRVTNPQTTTHSSQRRRRHVTQMIMGTCYAVVVLVLLWHWRLWHHHHAATTPKVPSSSALSLSSLLPIHPLVTHQTIQQQDNDDDDDEETDVVLANHTMVLTRRPKKPVVVAYAISLIKCGDHQSRATDLIDAAMVLRHSIHQTSIRSSNDGAASHYDYKMYAIVEQGAVSCSQVLRDLGFELLVRDTPVHDYEIQGEYLKNNVKKAWCCGAREFVKLYAYTLPEPLVVHLDVDFVMHKPMDTLFDVLLYDKDSVIGRTARAALEVERKQSAGEVIRLPDRPQAALTRDWGQVIPSLLDRHKPLYQAGFLAARTNPHVLQDVRQIIQTGHYTKMGGWGDLGYGRYLGAMAMQGLMAYYYDQHAAGEWIELSQCRYNHMGMDTKFRGLPNYSDQYKDLYGKCRNNAPYCEDCMVTSAEYIHNIHFTQCRKPWLCIGQGNEDIQHIRPLKRSALQKALIPAGSVHVDHCLQLAKIWHGHRSDLETKLAQLVSDDSVSWGRNGTYMTDVFQGHCSDLGPSGYLPVGGKVENLKLVYQIYNGD